MARQAYNETIAYIENSVMKVAEGVQVTVYFAETKEEAPIFASRSGNVPLANPILTGSDGLVSFWAETGDYDLFYHDTVAPARVGDATLGWQSSPPSSEIGFDLGDIKFSSAEEDHGRWLRMDGRSMSQGEVEAALNLQPGEGNEIMAWLGTGAGSKYGATAAGKIKLPDTRRSMIMGAGPTGDGPGGLTAREFGATGGAETVKLKTEHLPAHKHSSGTLVTSTTGSHSHGGASGSSAPSLSINSSPTSIGINGVGDHSHAVWGSYVTTGGGMGGGANIVATGGSYSLASYIGGAGGHSHGVSDPWHSHSGSAASHTHSISSDGSHSHTMSGETASTGTEVAHENMPPFVTLGHCFIRV